MVSVFGIQTVCMPDLDHTSSKGGVEYSACFQHSLASWYGRSVHAFWYPR